MDIPPPTPGPWFLVLCRDSADANPQAVYVGTSGPMARQIAAAKGKQVVAGGSLHEVQLLQARALARWGPLDPGRPGEPCNCGQPGPCPRHAITPPQHDD